MGLFDRLGKIATGVGGAIQAPFGLVKDLAVGAFTDDDEFDGFVGTIYGSVTKRGGQLFGELLGPQEGLGAAIGGLPGFVRTPARTVINPALEGLEFAGREVIREPLTALMTAASLYEAGEGFDLREGYRIAQNRSLGQAISLAILTEDITDEAEIAEAMGTDWYQAISGTFDAAARLTLEMDVLGGKFIRGARRATVTGRATGISDALSAGGMAERAGAAFSRSGLAAPLRERGVVGRTIRSGKDVEAALAHPALRVVNERIGEIKREAGILEIADPDVLPTPVRVIEPAEAGPLPAEPGILMSERGREPELVPVADGMPPLFHGTPRPIEGDRLDTTGAFDRHARNLFGSGFYTTSSEDIAQSYVKKDARRAGANLNPTTYSVRWTGDEPPRVLNLETPNPPPEAAAPFRDFINADSYYTAEMALDDIAEVNRLLDEGAPLSEVYRATKEAMSGAGIRSTEADELIQELNDRINQSGFDVLRYQGGKYAAKGQGEMHDAFIWLDPGKVEISRIERPREPGPLHGPREPKITEVAPEPVTRNEAAIDRAAARIRDLAFHDHRDGAIIARTLAEADDLDLAWGALMGHRPSVERMWAEKADVMGRISRLSGDQARVAQMERMVGKLGPDQLPLELPDEIAAIRNRQIDAELDNLYDTEARLLHNEQANATIQELPRISGASERRAQFTRSAFFQANPLAKPLRLAINMRPRNMIDLHDAAGDMHVVRLLRKANLPLEEQDALRGAYMAATDPTARNNVLARIEARSVQALAERHGITDPDKIQQLIDKASAGRAATMGKLMQSRRYDGQGRAFIEEIDPDTGVAHRIYVPLSVTQELNHFLLPDLDQLDKVFARHGDEVGRVGATLDAGGEFLEAFQRIWKPSVLIRVGWPLRVVGEEQLRIMSQIGALATVGRTVKAFSLYGKDTVADLVTNASQAIRGVPRSQRTFRGFTGEDVAATRGLRLGTMNIRGVEVESAFGTNRTFDRVVRNLNSAKPAFDQIVKQADDLRNGLRTEVLGEWQSLEPHMRGYAEGWENAVNRQIAGDELWRQFVEGKTLDEARTWLDTTAEGRKYRRRLRHWKGREDDWLDFMQQTVDEYLPTDELRTLALEGKATVADLERAIPDAAGRPVVHGAALADVSGKTRFAQAVGNLRDRTMKALGTTPTDILSRNNYFDYVYTQEVSRLIDIAVDQGMDLTPEVIRQFEKQARNHALGKSKALLYDMADESELSHMLRFISPFYSAWQEVLTRWTGIAIENPAFVARLHEVWRSPERMGIVTDENGNQINEDGTATVILTGEKVEAGRDRFVNMKLLASDNVVGKALFNDLTRSIPGVRQAENARFSKKGANLIAQGAPGVGPVVQIPVNEIAKGRPEIEDSVRWALPFGATQSTLAMLMPATARRAQTLMSGEEDRLYRNQLMRIYFDMQVDYNLGKRAEPPTYAEAERKTKDFWRMRTVASFVSPVAPSFQSPYQLYIDAYRALKEKDPQTADEKFLAQFGEEYFPLTQSLSRSVDGIPPTLEGAAARKKYQDLIEKHPDLGGLIVGAEGTGEFSSAVYQSQLQNQVAPGSEAKQREAFSFEEAQAKPQERLGWMEFSKAMALIDAERMNRGLPNLQVRAARDLADLKRNVIEGLREIAADDRLAGRDEIRGLRDYLEARDIILAELAARKAAGGASTLGSAGNQDLAGLWANITAQLVDENDLFSQLYYRYLERDPMSLETARQEVA